MKKKYIIAISVLLISFTIVVIGFFKESQFYHPDHVNAAVESAFVDKYTPVGNYPREFYDTKDAEIILSADGYFKRRYNVLTNDGIFKEPQVSMTESDIFMVLQVEIERSFLTNWKVVSLKRFDIRDSSYYQIRESLINNDDLTSNNLEFLSSEFPPLTQEEIDENRRNIEEAKNEDAVILREEQILDTGTPQQKLEVVASEIERVQQLLQERGEYSGANDLRAYIGMLELERYENEKLLKDEDYERKRESQTYISKTFRLEDLEQKREMMGLEIKRAQQLLLERGENTENIYLQEYINLLTEALDESPINE